jgi:hypothetical protein
MVRPAGFEPTTSRSAIWRSIQAELRAHGLRSTTLRQNGVYPELVEGGAQRPIKCTQAKERPRKGTSTRQTFLVNLDYSATDAIG